MKSFLFTFIMSILLMNPAAAQIVMENKIAPKPYAISHNVVFVVDASSTINYYKTIAAKFNKAWDVMVNQFGSDELYFCVYVFHDKKKEMRTEWVQAWPGEFRKAKGWVLKNTGTYSWGLKALRMAMREKCPLDKNPSTNARLTVVLMTDGGLTEAANRNSNKKDEEILATDIKEHIYAKTGDFNLINKMIKQEQARRIINNLEPATIMTIGIENIIADKEYGPSIKRPDAECQKWLSEIGNNYGGGYFHVYRRKP